MLLTTSTSGEQSYTMDFSDIEAKCALPSTKIFLLCSPHNPLGRVFSKSELTQLVEICAKHNVLILSDEIHSDLILPPHIHTPLATLSPVAAANSMTFLNPSKAFNVPGLKSAVAITPNAELRTKYDAFVKDNHSLGVSIFGAVGLKACYEEAGYYVDQLVKYLEKNVEYTLKVFKDQVPEIKVVKPEGTYLLWLDCRELKFETQEKLMGFFVEEVKIGLSDGGEFGEGGEGFLRMNVGCRSVTLKDAMKRVVKGVETLRARRVTVWREA